MEVIMSTKEKCINILDSFSDSQLLNVLTILEAAQNAIFEAEDDAFCNSLYNNYLNDGDKGEAISIEEFAESLGIQL